MTKIVLDVGSGLDVSDELYDLLLAAFYARAEAMGMDTANPRALFDNWRIECEFQTVE
jgi:hypothetical protein